MAIENTDLLVAYRQSDQTHYKLSIDDIGNYIDLTYGSYLRTDSAAGAQTVASTGTTTFDGLVEAGNAVHVSGGTQAPGTITGNANGTLTFNQTNTASFKNAQEALPFSFLARDLTKNTNSNVVQFSCSSTGHSATDSIFINLSKIAADTGAGSLSFYYTNVSAAQNRIDAKVIGYESQISEPAAPNGQTYNFFSGGSSPNFFAGNTYIGGTTARNTRELWESLLTEEQKEELAAGTLVVPANVSLPGDGSFARQWWYDQQDEETQALIDAGELDYPEHFAATTFTDTFAFGDNTAINLLSSGNAILKGSYLAVTSLFDETNDVAGSTLYGGLLRIKKKSTVNPEVTAIEVYRGPGNTPVASINLGGRGEFSGGVGNANWTIEANGTTNGLIIDGGEYA